MGFRSSLDFHHALLRCLYGFRLAEYFEPETPRCTVLRTMDTEFRLVSRFLPLPHGKLGPYYHIGPYSPDRLFSFCSAFQAKGKDSLCTALFPVVAYRRLAQRLHLARELSFFCYCRYDLRRYESYVGS